MAYYALQNKKTMERKCNGMAHEMLIDHCCSGLPYQLKSAAKVYVRCFSMVVASYQ